MSEVEDDQPTLKETEGSAPDEEVPSEPQCVDCNCLESVCDQIQKRRFAQWATTFCVFTAMTVPASMFYRFIEEMGKQQWELQEKLTLHIVNALAYLFYSWCMSRQLTMGIRHQIGVLLKAAGKHWQKAPTLDTADRMAQYGVKPPHLEPSLEDERGKL